MPERIARLVGVCAAIAVISGCAYNIKLDPMDQNAQVSVNGEPQGRGQVNYGVGAQYGWPDSFGVKVTPASGAPYTVRVARQFDAPRAIIQTVVSLGVGVALLVGDLQAGYSPVSSLIVIAYAPLGILDSFYYNEYYDLTKLKAAQGVGYLYEGRPGVPPIRFAADATGLQALALPTPSLQVGLSRVALDTHHTQTTLACVWPALGSTLAR